MKRIVFWGLVLCLLALWALPAPGVPVAITDSDIVATTGNELQSGNGLLDIILFLEAEGAGVAGNSAGSINVDDANTDLPTGNAAGKDTANETFITSFGELRDFYDTVFGPGNISEIVLCVDVNETGGNPNDPLNFITLNTLDLITDFTSPTTGGRNAPFTNDITSATQNSTGGAIVGGTLIAALDGPKQLDINEQGAGFADYFIHTGIDPFDPAFSDTTRIAFHVALADLDNGGETIFISGSFDGGGPQEEPIPEPGTLALLGVGIAGLIVRRRARRK